jgi:hypothetical protein
MPITLPEQAAEHPDVTALKERVREVATKYAKNHNWCGVVKQALREAGIEDPNSQKIAVTISFTVAGSEAQTAVKKFNVSDLVGKTHEEQMVWIAEKIAPKVDVAGTQVTLPVAVLDIDGTFEARTSSGLIVVDGLEYPQGYIHYYTSDDSRVAHLGRHRWDPEGINHPDALREWHLAARRSYLRGICASSQSELYGAPRPTSSRSEHRICARCLPNANARVADENEG